MEQEIDSNKKVFEIVKLIRGEMGCIKKMEADGEDAAADFCCKQLLSQIDNYIEKVR